MAKAGSQHKKMAAERKKHAPKNDKTTDFLVDMMFLPFTAPLNILSKSTKKKRKSTNKRKRR